MLLLSKVVSVADLSNVVSPGNVPSPNCLTLPIISPDKLKFNPGGNLPLFKVYTTLPFGMFVVAFTKNVLIRFAFIVPRSLAVVQVIVDSISPNKLTVKVLSLKDSNLLCESNLCALIVNLYSFVTAGW